jgi:glycosyltransferase involved in cell wall biosynthesis
MLQQLQEMAAHRNASTRVHFIGHVDATDKIGAYHASDLLVIPSRQEAMSIVVLEAGACNRPVLITDCCGFNEVERIGGGRVVPASAEGLESGLLEMLRDADALRSMGERLGALVRHNFLWEFAARKYLALFSRVVH